MLWHKNQSQPLSQQRKLIKELRKLRPNDELTKRRIEEITDSIFDEIESTPSDYLTEHIWVTNLLLVIEELVSQNNLSGYTISRILDILRPGVNVNITNIDKYSRRFTGWGNEPYLQILKYQENLSVEELIKHCDWLLNLSLKPDFNPDISWAALIHGEIKDRNYPSELLLELCYHDNPWIRSYASNASNCPRTGKIVRVLRDLDSQAYVLSVHR